MAPKVTAMTTVGTPGNRFESPRAVNDALRSVGYLADEGTAAVVFLADRLGKPVLVEGPCGYGQDPAGQVRFRDDRGQAHPSAVLRRARRVEGPL